MLGQGMMAFSSHLALCSLGSYCIGPSTTWWLHLLCIQQAIWQNVTTKVTPQTKNLEIYMYMYEVNYLAPCPTMHASMDFSRDFTSYMQLLPKKLSLKTNLKVYAPFSCMLYTWDLLRPGRFRSRLKCSVNYSIHVHTCCCFLSESPLPTLRAVVTVCSALLKTWACHSRLAVEGPWPQTDKSHKQARLEGSQQSCADNLQFYQLLPCSLSAILWSYELGRLSRATIEVFL